MSYPPQYPQPGQPVYGEPPLSAPYYGASLPIAFRRFWTKYAVFSGRASRSEYWWWMLISVAVVIVVEILMAIAGAAGASTTSSGTVTPGPGAGLVAILLILWGLATVVPGLALGVRRLHDANLSGWLLLLALVPFLGGLAVLIMTLLPSNSQGQRFDRRTGTTAQPYPGTY